MTGTYVTWFLACDDDREVITTSDDILDVIEARTHVDRDTRITDREPAYYEPESDVVGARSEASSLG